MGESEVSISGGKGNWAKCGEVWQSVPTVLVTVRV